MHLTVTVLLASLGQRGPWDVELSMTKLEPSRLTGRCVTLLIWPLHILIYGVSPPFPSTLSTRKMLYLPTLHSSPLPLEPSPNQSCPQQHQTTCRVRVPVPSSGPHRAQHFPDWRAQPAALPAALSGRRMGAGRPHGLHEAQWPWCLLDYFRMWGVGKGFGVVWQYPVKFLHNL